MGKKNEKQTKPAPLDILSVPLHRQESQGHQKDQKYEPQQNTCEKQYTAEYTVQLVSSTGNMTSKTIIKKKHCCDYLTALNNKINDKDSLH